MNKPRTVWNEIIGLFADDKVFAIAIVAWLVLVRLAITHVSVAPIWRAIGMFAGLAMILGESATRAARR